MFYFNIIMFFWRVQIRFLSVADLPFGPLKISVKRMSFVPYTPDVAGAYLYL